MKQVGIAPAAEAAVGAFLEKFARLLALFGGVILAAIAVTTVVSVIGRAFIFAGLGPIPGDFEIVQTGCAVAVFSFLPWCQLKRGHVTVDIVTDRFPARGRAVFSLVGDIALCAAAILIAWRLWLGLNEKISYGEETYILAMPVWWGYALSMVGAALFAVIGAYTVWRGVNEVARGDGEAHTAEHV